METNNKNVSKKSRRFTLSIILYVVAVAAALVGIASLAINIYLFKNTVTQYVAQGYDAAMVTKQLILSQLLPAIFQSIAVYGGIAFVLLGIGILNKKVSKCLLQLNKVEVCNDTVEESISEENIVDIENTETPENIETSEHTNTAE